MMLSANQLDEFRREGCLIARKAVDVETLEAVRAEYSARVDDLRARGIRAGRVLPDDAQDFGEKVTRLICGAPDVYQHLDISLPLDENMSARVDGWRDLFGDDWREEAGVFAGESVYRLLSHPGIAAIVRQMVGERVICSPVQHVRIKPPQHLLSAGEEKRSDFSRTLWHQDEAVVHEGARGANILTVWIAMTDATRENGCLSCAPGSHLSADDDLAEHFGLTPHCPGRGGRLGEIYVPDELIPRGQRRFLEAEAGDVILLHRRIIHGAGANRSAGIRWSFDLRYQPEGTETGRECFPSFPLQTGEKGGARAYRRRWMKARDDILSGKTRVVFNSRWRNRLNEPLCA